MLLHVKYIVLGKKTTIWHGLATLAVMATSYVYTFVFMHFYTYVRTSHQLFVIAFFRKMGSEVETDPDPNPSNPDDRK